MAPESGPETTSQFLGPRVGRRDSLGRGRAARLTSSSSRNGSAMRKDRRDLFAPERGGGGHGGRSLLGVVPLILLSGAGSSRCPQRPARSSISVRRRTTSGGSAPSPGRVARTSPRTLFTRTTGRRPPRPRSEGAGETTRTDRSLATSRTEVRRRPHGVDCLDGHDVGAVAARPIRLPPSQVTTCEPGPIPPVNAVATHLPSRITFTETVAETFNGTVSEARRRGRRRSASGPRCRA